jgi:arylsulfatase A-like enzyme
VPFIARWPGHVVAGSTSDQLVCLTDLFATTSDITDVASPAGSAEDSVSFLPALSGAEIVSTRAGVIHHSISGHFAYRLGKWKLILARGSAGWTGAKENQIAKNAPKAQLYDMQADPAETTNLYQSHPEVAARLLAQLESDVFNGRSTQGPTAKNDTDTIKLWKNAR